MKKKLKRFWKEWGFSKEDLDAILGLLGLALFLYEVYIILWLLT